MTAALAGASAYVALGNPYQQGFFPGCPYLAVSGHWCPGCGGLRATHELLNGDVVAALGMNPVVVFVVIPLAIVGLAWWWARAMGARVPKLSLTTGQALVLPAFLVVFWVVRNIPFLEPYLAP